MTQTRKQRARQINRGRTHAGVATNIAINHGAPSRMVKIEEGKLAAQYAVDKLLADTCREIQLMHEPVDKTVKGVTKSMCPECKVVAPCKTSMRLFVTQQGLTDAAVQGVAAAMLMQASQGDGFNREFDTDKSDDDSPNARGTEDEPGFIERAGATDADA